ncbi:hypothetical protein DAPPUDRAFT_117940 [Daphnia pulex]|uniref:Uncharacterized protein n=1 Tax=Daphnia pulex TaxID=6669 RepID=E9HU73_DAPPU|nr:hypothetical protein DAPPUDRAFT_117940 [Daphnia pulex]|eukprot:EFX64691.1 hypothetical protein DAPPUDRAFT_117940 [Daphnia pulex]
MNANFNPGEKIQEYKDMIFYDQRERGCYGLNNARNKIWIKLIKFSFLDPTQPTTTTKDVTDEASTGSAIEIINVNSTNDLPEIRKIEEDYMKKKDKENKKDAVKRRLLPLKEVTQHPSNIPATRPTVKRRIQRENKNNEDKARKHPRAFCYRRRTTSTRSRFGRVIKYSSLP